MKLLVDMNLSPSWADRLVRHGFEAVHWSTIGAATAPDVEILACANEHEFVLIGDASAFAAFQLRARNARTVVVDLSAAPSRAASSEGYRSPADLLRMSRAVWREPADVFFNPTVYSFFPLPPGLAAVVTVHDAIAERFPELTLPSRRARLFWRAKVKLALRQASTSAVAVSRSSSLAGALNAISMRCTTNTTPCSSRSACWPLPIARNHSVRARSRKCR